MSKKRRRAANEGAVYRLPNGRWRAQVRTRGGRISHTADSEREAAAWARQVCAQAAQGLTYDAARTRLDEFLAGWLRQKQTMLRPATTEQYDWAAANYICPGIGKMLLREISPAVVQRFYDQLLADGAGARTVQVVHAVMHGCMDHAARLGLTARNPADGLIVPRPKKQEMMVWTESQVSQFLTSVRGERNEVLYRLALATGMRRGELLGLKWGDIDWLAATIRVRRQVFEPRGGGFIFQEPKSDRGRRSIQLGGGIIEQLRGQIEQVDLARKMARGRWKEHDLIFPSTVGTPQGGGFVSREFKRLAERAGLPAIRFHGCRHTAASIMLMRARPPLEVAGILGHSLAVLMERYAHYIPDQQGETARLMDEITMVIPIEIGVRD